MDKWLTGLELKKYQDRSGLAGSKQGPFVWTEVFLCEVNQQPQQGILHYWPMDTTVILGMMDSQVPDLAAGLAHIKQAGYSPIIRSLGGLAVVADQGVLNLTLILPNAQGHQVNLHESYQVMVDLISQSLADFPVQVESGEIATSYCPGTHDLSIQGRKFAGLAQRVYKQAIAISAYISVHGNQAERGQLVADFYQASSGGQPIPDRYPQVIPDSMANLSDLVGRELTVEEMRKRIEVVLERNGARLSNYYPSSDNMADFMDLGRGIKEFQEKYGI
ncbi:TPA: lipoate--protein ligase family protein [Streptococcus suis]